MELNICFSILQLILSLWLCSAFWNQNSSMPMLPYEVCDNIMLIQYIEGK